MKNNSKSIGIGICDLLACIFIVLKGLGMGTRTTLDSVYYCYHCDDSYCVYC